MLKIFKEIVHFIFELHQKYFFGYNILTHCVRLFRKSRVNSFVVYRKLKNKIGNLSSYALTRVCCSLKLISIAAHSNTNHSRNVFVQKNNLLEIISLLYSIVNEKKVQ